MTRADNTEGARGADAARPSSNTIICGVFPRPLPDNPYQRLLHAALEQHGVEFRTAAKLTPWWIIGERPDVIHLHWLEYLVFAWGGGRASKFLRSVARGVRLLASLAVLKIRGVRLVWTVHNLRPHESRYPRLEHMLSKLVYRLADGVVVHSAYAAQRVTGVLGDSDKLVVAHHGNYLGWYPPPTATRETLRQELGIPETAFVFLAFGGLRPYKRIPEIITAFAKLGQAEAYLLIAGNLSVDSERERIARAAAAHGRVLLRPGFVPESEVAGLHLVADVAVLNHREIFSSGALLLALSLGLPVLAFGSGAVAEVGARPAVTPFASGELTNVMRDRLEGKGAQHREIAVEAARRWTWENMASRIEPLYRG